MNPSQKTSPNKIKTARIGSYSVVITVVVIVMAILVNLIVNRLPTTYTQFDVSSAGLYTLSEQTESMVSGLDQDITIYWIVQTGNENNSIQRLLDRYQALSDRITVTKVDPVINPTFAQQYTDEQLSNNSLVVESDLRAKYVGYDDIVLVDYMEYYTTGQATPEFNGESALTGAIDYVTSDTLPVDYTLTGHGEFTLEDDMATKIAGQNIELKELNLLSAGSIPADCSTLLLLSPQTDLSSQECEMILAYLQQGGHLFLITDFTRDPTPNLESILDYYGVNAVEGMAVEGDGNASIYQYPHYILPTLNAHAITDPLIAGGSQVIVPFAQGIQVHEDLRDGLEVTQLLTTSDQAYSKVDGINLTTFTREENDIAGPFALGVAVSEAVEGSTTQLVWYPTSYLMDLNSDLTGGNLDLMLNSISWLCEHESGISIHAKSMAEDFLVIPAGTVNVLTLVLVVLVPLALLAAGMIITIRRRRK